MAIPAMTKMTAITTSNSMSVKPRPTGGGELLVIVFLVRSASYCACGANEREKELQKQDCLTRDFAFGVCRSCPSKSLFHLRLRQVRAPSSAQNQHQPVYLQTWLRHSPAFH